jgi:hypothetical protein
VQHLVTTIEQFLPAFDAALADTPRREAALDAPYRQSVVGRLFVWLLEPPYRIRFRTAPPFVPEHARAPDVDLDAFLQRHRELGTRLDTGRDRAIDQVMLPSPFDARVRYSIFTAFRVIPAHERRHLWQAEQALAALERS